MTLGRPMLARCGALVVTGADNAFPGAALAPREPSKAEPDAGGTP
jgi:hypothetical protein